MMVEPGQQREQEPKRSIPRHLGDKDNVEKHNGQLTVGRAERSFLVALRLYLALRSIPGPRAEHNNQKPGDGDVVDYLRVRCLQTCG